MAKIKVLEVERDLLKSMNSTLNGVNIDMDFSDIEDEIRNLEAEIDTLNFISKIWWGILIKMRKLLKHTFKAHIELPFLNSKGSFFWLQIYYCQWWLSCHKRCNRWYICWRNNRYIYYDGNNVGVFAAHDFDITNRCNVSLILDFIDFIKSNIDFERYENEPTSTGMVELSLEDCNKIEDWGKSHMFNESVIFDKILKKIL